MAKRFLIALGILVVVFVVFIRVEQSSWLFVPAVYPAGDWSSQHLYGAQDHTVVASDGTHLDAWWVPGYDAKRTVLFFHSRRGNIADQSEHILRLRALQNDIFLLDYRGYGKSQGQPSQAGIYRDGEAAYEYVTGVMHIPPSKLVIQGDEIGSAVAARVASTHPQVAGLVLENPFPDVRRLGNSVMFAGGYLMSNELNEIPDVRSYAGPKLFIYPANDPDIPSRLSEAVFDAASQPKTKEVVADTTATELIVTAGDDYPRWLRDFYSQVHLPGSVEPAPNKGIPLLPLGPA
jgi:pimeloyl-ACP methyl ester carboxylesterase